MSQPRPPGDAPAPRRRAKGAGSIHQRAADGKWIAQIELPSTGRRKRARRVCATRREAEAALRALVQARDTGQAPPDPRVTVGTFLRDWLTTIQARVTAETYAHRESAVRLYLVPEIGRVPLGSLTPAQVAAMLARLEARGVKPHARNHARMYLRTALNLALAQRLVSYNAAALVHSPAPPPREPVVLTPAQARALLAATAGTMGAPICTLALYCGLRQGEILALTWRDIDLGGGLLTVNATLTPVRRERKPPKTRKSRRTLALVPAVVAALRAHREWQKAAMQPVLPDSFLFIEPSNGRPLAPAVLSRAFRTVWLPAAGLPPMAFHHLRHAFASLLHAAGVPVGTIAQLAGHSTPRVTLGTYINPQGGELRAGLERIADLLAAPESGQEKRPANG